MTPLSFDNSFAQLPDDFYSRVQPTPIREPWLIASNAGLAKELGIEPTALDSPAFLACAAGEQPLSGMQPIAQVYSGHQFGQWAGQLGDGRGILLGELNAFDLHLKGAGKTPYSRFADGRAVLRSSIREFLCGEYMHQLGIPTSRALSLVGSSEPVYREHYESAAMIIRVAESHVRFGHFEHFHYASQPELVKVLADYVMAKHFPNCSSYSQWFTNVVDLTAKMIALWQAYGFTHGVMNTDNMSILGLTLDYGPYGFIDDYQPNFVCNHSDHQGRYAYDQQPSIGLWNLRALAMALTTLIDNEDLKAGLDHYSRALVKYYLEAMNKRLGLIGEEREHEGLLAELLALMDTQGCDYHIALQMLGEDSAAFCRLFNLVNVEPWLAKYSQACQTQDLNEEQRLVMMAKHNPKIVLRNHHAQSVIAACEKGDSSPLLSFYQALQRPFDAPKDPRWSEPPSESDKGTVLSCSS